jgi:hypothetical protein
VDLDAAKMRREELAHRLAAVEKVATGLMADVAQVYRVLDAIHLTLWRLGLQADEWRQSFADVEAREKDGSYEPKADPQAVFVRLGTLIHMTASLAACTDALVALLVEKGVITDEEYRGTLDRQIAEFREKLQSEGSEPRLEVVEGGKKDAGNASDDA